jgi:hypothetical protein
MSAKEFLNIKGNGESPYGDVIWNFDTASNDWLCDLLEEYKEFVLRNLGNTTKIIQKQYEFEGSIDLVECCEIGPITHEKYCPKCGKKIVRQ